MNQNILDQIEFQCDKGAIAALIAIVALVVIAIAVSCLKDFIKESIKNKRTKTQNKLAFATREETINNFFLNRIDEDVMSHQFEMSDNGQKLVNLYND